MRIFIIGLISAGNLGDDLISTLLVQHIVERWPDAEIGLLVGEYENQFGYPAAAKLVRLHRPQRSAWSSYRKRWFAIKEFLANTDLIFIGGGGLFQDSHYLFTPHNWLSFAFVYNSRCPVWAVGVGFGPLKHSFTRLYLQRALERFSLIQVRDEDSRSVVKSLGYWAESNPDIVTGSEIKDLFNVGDSSKERRKTLGCSIRPWPGLDFAKLLSVIIGVCAEKQVEHVALFVFEYVPTNITDELIYAEKLANSLSESGITATIYCYGRDPIKSFLYAFREVDCAIAVRFHANVLWQKLAIPVLPISYAPKVKQFYEELGGKVIPIQQIEPDKALEYIQLLPMSETYCLPIMSPQSVIVPSKHKMMKLALFNRLVHLVETTYSLSKNIFRRIRTSPEIRI